MTIQSLFESLTPAARRTGMMLALGSALIAAPLLAQDNDGPPPPPQHQHEGMHGDHHMQMEHMKKHLNLTDDQVNQIEQIHQQYQPQMKALHEDTTVSKEDRRSKMMEMRKDEHDKIRAVLNDEQKEKFDKMAEKREEKHEKREQTREDRHNDNAAPIPNAQPAPPSI